MVRAIGHVSQIQGSVVDVEFPKGELPEIYEVIEIPVRVVDVVDHH